MTVDAGSPTDFGFTGGSTTTVPNSPGDTTVRFGNFSYDLLVDPGAYLVSFRWLENTATGPGQRKFRVTINDQVFFDQLDLFVACGYMKECMRTVLVINTGHIHIQFTTQTRNAIVSGISVDPTLVLTSVKNCIAMVGPANCKGMRLAGAVGTANQYIMLQATPEAIGAMVWK